MSNPLEIIILMFMFSIKHFIIDFILQTKYQWSNKGTLGHPGGILHAGLHAIGTYAALFFFAPFAGIFLAMFDMIAHYFIDYSKMNINRKMGWGPTTHEEFWWLVGLDQMLHSLTYIFIIWMIVA